MGNEQKNWEKEMLKEYGWYMDVISAEEYDGIHANYHTHGVQENFNHMDFQIVLNMDPEVVNHIFFDLINDVSKGTKFIEGEEYSDVIEGFNVVFKNFEEMGRTVLRVLLPDQNGILPTEVRCDDHYKVQLDNYSFETNE